MSFDLGSRVRLRLPATSANLGPAFDTAAVALNLHLEVTAEAAEAFAVSATGRNAEACGRLEKNLILDTYRQVLLENGRGAQPIRLHVSNEIPLGMGCGSSAAARLAGIALAVCFGELGWRDKEILTYAAVLEGHPDNVSACWLGGMTVAAMPDDPGSVVSEGKQRLAATRKPCGPIQVARFDIPVGWRAAVVIPVEPVRTEESRKVLPERYSRSHVVANLQHSALLVAAFATGNGDLLRAAMRDCLHEPYRMALCPLLQPLRALGSSPDVFGVALSGAGPGVLLIANHSLCHQELEAMVAKALTALDEVPGSGEVVRAKVEILQCGLKNRGVERDTAFADSGAIPLRL